MSSKRSTSLILALIPWVLLGCRTEDDHEGHDMAPGPDMIQTAACPAPVAPPQGARCAVTPARGGNKNVLLRGTLLLPDKTVANGEIAIDAQGQIACLGDLCACGGKEALQGAAVVDCPEGVISPGLINPHDHITYTKAAPVPHEMFRYDHRHEWRRGVPGDPNKPRLNVPGGNNASAVQWGELRHVLSGATSLAGSGQAKGFLRNIDTTAQEGLTRTPLDFDTFPLGDSGGQMLDMGCGYPNIHDPMALLSVDAYLPHIGEGINAAARNEFLCVSSSDGGAKDLLGRRTAMIHSIALNAEDARTVANRRTAVIWSPRSNIDLYGHTAQIPMLDRAGVLVALGTDWSASGSMNMLRELRCADELNKRQFGGYLSDEDLWKMVTLNAALATGVVDTMGQLRVGLVGDIAVYQAGAAPERRGHGAVVRGEVKDVLLVLRGGLPLSGDANILEGLGQGDATCEKVDMCGVQKRICAMRETGKKLADLETAATKPIYPLFFCDKPMDEPSCVPLRKGEFTGEVTEMDPDGDGLTGMDDNCPKVFNPVRPMDQGKQPDSDGDGVGDACDACPLDKDAMMCLAPDPMDRDEDGIPDTVDNCLGAANKDQADQDKDGVGDACDGCPAFSNLGGVPCPFTVRELRDPALGKKPKAGTRVVVQDLLVTAVRAKRAYGFYGRDLMGPADYSGILVFMGGSAAPKATDGTPIEVGQIVTVRGEVGVFSSQDQIANVTEVKVTGKGQVEPITGLKAADFQGGMNEKAVKLMGQVVRLENVFMRRMVPPPMGGQEDDFYVTEDMAETCAAEPPACARIGDYLLDGDQANMQPPFTANGVIKSLTGVVSVFRDAYPIELRTAADLTP
jgi:hypothetical protein